MSHLTTALLALIAGVLVVLVVGILATLAREALLAFTAFVFRKRSAEVREYITALSQEIHLRDVDDKAAITYMLEQISRKAQGKEARSPKDVARAYENNAITTTFRRAIEEVSTAVMRNKDPPDAV